MLQNACVVLHYWNVWWYLGPMSTPRRVSYANSLPVHIRLVANDRALYGMGTMSSNSKSGSQIKWRRAFDYDISNIVIRCHYKKSVWFRSKDMTWSYYHPKGDPSVSNIGVLQWNLLFLLNCRHGCRVTGTQYLRMFCLSWFGGITENRRYETLMVRFTNQIAWLKYYRQMRVVRKTCIRKHEVVVAPRANIHVS